MRRFLAAAALAFLASPLHAGWTFFSAQIPPYGTGGFETSLVAVGRDPRDICLAASVVPIAPHENFRGEVWCLTDQGWVLQHDLVMNFRASVAAQALRGDGYRPRWVISDPAAGTIWYGIADDPPELISPTRGFGVSLSHFSDGTPFVTYNGFPPNNHVYYATREGEWAAFQLTNNFTYPPVPPFDRSVASVVRNDVVHVAYWDDTYSAVRYATKARFGAWKFETVLDSPGTRLLPSIAADDEGRPHIVLAHPDGKLHVFIRQADGWQHEAVSVSPAASIQYRNVGLQIDRRGAVHVALSARNGDTPLVLYLRKGRGGAWGAPEIVEQGPTGYESDAFYGLSLALHEDALPGPPQPRVSYMFFTFVGVIRLAFRTRD